MTSDSRRNSAVGSGTMGKVVSWGAAVQSMAWGVAERVIALAPALAATLVAARVLAPAEFGQLNLLLALVTILTTVATAGLRDVSTRALARGGHSLQAVRNIAQAVAFTSFVALCIAIAVGAALVDDLAGRIALVVLAIRLVVLPLEAPIAWFYASVDLRRLALVRATSSAVLLAGLAAAYAFAPTIVGFAAVWALEAFAWSCAITWAYLAFRPRSLAAAPAPKAVDLLRESLPLMLSSVSVVLYVKIDQVMLPSLASAHAAGIYAAAARLSEAAYFLPGVVGAVVFPMFVRSAANPGSSPVTQEHRSIQDLLVFGALATMGFCWFFADALIQLTYGAAYAASADVLRIHICAYAFVCLGVIRGRWLLAHGMVRFEAMATASGAVINIALNVVLIPVWGAEGAAWATVISYAISGYVTSALAAPLRPVFLAQSAALLSPVTLPVAAAMWIIRRRSARN